MYFYSLNISYDGNDFYGSAKQKNIRTVEGELNKAINKILNAEIELVFAGRTDKHVHAINQTVSFSHVNLIKYSKQQFIFILNKLLPLDIRVLNFKRHKKFFNARFNCIERSYLYLIELKPHNLFQRNYVLSYQHDISLNKLNELKKYFLGEHDFLSFSTSEKTNTIREIKNFQITKVNNLIKIKITANGFLRSQIRMIVACLLAYNENKITIDDVLNLLNYPKKGASHTKVSGKGLYFLKAKYK